jgi:hypothetical protein
MALVGTFLLVPTAPADIPNLAYSPNWSGYVATGSSSNPQSFTSATGTWTVPTATCSTAHAGEFSVVAVGLGGWPSTSKMQEVGTDANCDNKGKPSYYAWFEVVPYPAYQIKNKLSPGDTVTALVKVLPANFVDLQLTDQTAGWTWQRNISWSLPDTLSAEWLVVAPASCIRFTCSQASLANFGSVNMRAVSAVANGNTGTLTDSDWTVTPIQLVPGPTFSPDLGSGFSTTGGKTKALSPAGAAPGAVSADGSSFSVQWLPVSTKGV